MKAIKSVLFIVFFVTFCFACCPTRPTIEGCYKTAYFDKINDTIKPYQSNVLMQLSMESRDSVVGSWESDHSGKIYGKLDPSGRVLTGTWKTTNYEGKIKFIFDNSSNFEGFWNGTTPRGTIKEWLSWNGTKTICNNSKK